MMYSMAGLVNRARLRKIFCLFGNIFDCLCQFRIFNKQLFYQGDDGCKILVRILPAFQTYAFRLCQQLLGFLAGLCYKPAANNPLMFFQQFNTI